MINMKKEFIIKDDIFKTSVLFVVNCDQNEFKRRVKSRGAKDVDLSEYSCGTVIGAGGNFFRAVWVKNFTKKPRDIAEFAHEVVHLVVRICDDKGVPIKANIETGEVGDETFAYLTEFYMDKGLNQLKK